jgi:hypothetical protein
VIERIILKDKHPLERLKAVLGNHPDWEYVVSERHAAWHIKIDRGGETLDDELQEHEAYPDPRVAYLVEVSHVDAKVGKVKVRRGSHERSLDVSTSKQVGEKAVLIFLEGDRSKPILIS